MKKNTKLNNIRQNRPKMTGVVMLGKVEDHKIQLLESIADYLDFIADRMLGNKEDDYEPRESRYDDFYR
jgi:hypothetical protein